MPTGEHFWIPYFLKKPEGPQGQGGLPRWLKNLPGNSQVQNSPAKAGDTKHSGLFLQSGRSHEGGNGNPLLYSCLGNSHGQRSLAGYSPWGHKESDMTQQLKNNNKGQKTCYLSKHYPNSQICCSRPSTSKLPMKGQIVNILGFVGHMVFGKPISLQCWSVATVINNAFMKGSGCVWIKCYLQKEATSRIWPEGGSWPPPALDHKSRIPTWIRAIELWGGSRGQGCFGCYVRFSEK